MHSKLDNPVWNSLNETHKPFSVSYTVLKCYLPDYCPFGGCQPGDVSADIDKYANLINNFYVVGEKPALSGKLTISKELVCLQMIIDKPIETDNREPIIPLGKTYEQDLFDLVNLVQPGYFRNKTMLLGDYFGTIQNDKLVAVTGERMKMNEYTEVSAVVTHPDHTGKGYATQLIAHTVNKILAENKLPYLHVAQTNTRAIDLYQKLGFATRRKISFWNIVDSH